MAWYGIWAAPPRRYGGRCSAAILMLAGGEGYAPAAYSIFVRQIMLKRYIAP